MRVQIIMRDKKGLTRQIEQTSITQVIEILFC